MSDSIYPPPRPSRAPGSDNSANLADILERVLDKGIVIAGDIRVDLLNVELLTIKLRLIVASVERAEAMGIDWWRRDPHLTGGHQSLAEENRLLRERVALLEKQAAQPGARGETAEPVPSTTAWPGSRRG